MHASECLSLNALEETQLNPKRNTSYVEEFHNFYWIIGYCQLMYYKILQVKSPEFPYIQCDFEEKSHYFVLFKCSCCVGSCICYSKYAKSVNTCIY